MPSSSTLTSPPAEQPVAKGELEARFVGDVGPHLQVLASVARRFAHNPRDAEDLFQETLLKAYASFHLFRGGSSLKAWLLQIMKRTSIDTYRATQRRPRVVFTGQFTDTTSGAFPCSTLVSASAETEHLDASIGDELRQAMSSLAEPLRIVVYYAYVEGRTYNDIATVLNLPLGTVMSRIYRARQQLRAHLAVTSDAAEHLTHKKTE